MTKITTQQILVMASVLAIVPVTSAYATTCLPDQPCCDPMINPWNCWREPAEYVWDWDYCPYCGYDFKFDDQLKYKIDTTVNDKFDVTLADELKSINIGKPPLR